MSHGRGRIGRGSVTGLVLSALGAVACTAPHPQLQPAPSIFSPTPAPSRTAAQSTSTSAAPLAAPQFRQYCQLKDPLRGVYSPGRLAIRNVCVAVTGVTADVNREHDGDMHISLTGVDPRWLNAGNLKRTKQDLVVEVVPALPADIPPVGATITVIGPWVLDTQTGWMEIHPVFKIIQN